MTIRKATPNDTAEIATFLMLAMEDIVYGFIGENSKECRFRTIPTHFYRRNRA